MVTAELNASKIKEPFLVFTGIKMDDIKIAISYLQTNDYKFSIWRDNELRVSFMNFQYKYWFDKDITIRYLKTLVYEMYPNLKVGLIWD